MRKYQVFAKDGTAVTVVRVDADDVNLETADGPDTAFWNFILESDEGEDSVTVATFPFAGVAYIVSEAA